MTLTLSALLVLLVPAIVLTAVWTLVTRQMITLRRRSALFPLDWTLDLKLDRYRPMFRLLDEEDIRFLRSQPGSTPALVRRFRQQRCRVFRSYLRSLDHDFHVASDALMLVMVQSQSDRHDVIRSLIGSRVKFAIGVFRVRCKLLLYRWDVGHESVGRLVDLFEGLQLELLALAPTPAGAESYLRP